MTFKERERAFYIGAPLAIAPALLFLPAVVFLVIIPKFAWLRAIAFVFLPALAAASGFGLWKLALAAVQKPFNVLTALSVGAMMVLLVIAAYTGIFLAVVATKM
jgi:hypothetical protein